MKTCKDCQEEKPLSEFYVEKRTQKPFGYCKPCSSKRSAAWRSRNAEQHRSYARQWHITNSYGLSPEQYQIMLDAGCQICGIKDGLAVDHDHACCPGRKTCGKCVRGMLCRPHNLAAGYLNDSPDEARKLASYLEKGLY